MSARILIVEDEAIAALAISHMHESRGFSVIGVAACGENTLEFAQKLSPDLVLIDVPRSGSLSGNDSARIIQSERRVPVIFTTAYSTNEVQDLCVPDDSVLFITKPILEEELVRAVSSVLSNSPV